MAALKSIAEKVSVTETNLEEMDQYSRSENLLIHGIPHPHDGSIDKQLDKTICDLINSNMPGITLSETDISVSHRMGRPLQHRADSASSYKPQPVIVRFARRSVRNNILTNRKVFRG